MSKRKKFIISAGVLSGAFLVVLLTNFLFRYEAIILITIASFLICAWALRDTLSKNLTLLTLILPVMFTAGVGFFYFLIPPTTVLARIPVVLIYALGMYALLLTANIYNVAAIRTIALLRAAHAVGFLLTLATSFFVFDTIWSLHLASWFNGPIIGLLSFPLVLQSLWSIELSERISKLTMQLTVVISLVVGEVSFMLSFWPVSVAVASLFLTSILYTTIGLSQAKIAGRLFSRTVREYLLVGVIVFIAAYLSSRWGG
ncbi:hypothetical protein HYZ78_04135 [Candidatus Microgenomates bacterium]|nr:hypothetical protein [Candidatus Microgenomates bacterium]